jgi:hypothetical protein
MRENPYVGAGGVQGWTEHRYFPGSPQAVSGSWWEALWGGPGREAPPIGANPTMGALAFSGWLSAGFKLC